MRSNFATRPFRNMRPALFPQLPPFLCLLVVALLVGDFRSVQTQELTPPLFNLAAGRRVTATATCGEGVEEPELYCYLVGANKPGNENKDEEEHLLIQGQICDHCDPRREDKYHPAEHAVDGAETWWQSPPLSRGMKYNEVNLTIELGQEFHVAYVLIKMGNSPRPAVWALERSADNGKTYSPWQYFSDTLTDCELYFGPDSLKPMTADDSVPCVTQYSKIVPLEGGEIVISLLENRPSRENFFNSTVLQEFTRATNVRLRLLKTKNLLGHLMSVAKQDPTTTRRYFYSIKDISIGGRCRCNGHAVNCDQFHPENKYQLICRCQHNTCGDNCEVCCPGFEQKAWRQSLSNSPFTCEPCNCHGHADKCIYNATIAEKRQSLDINGNYEGGGVCQNCRDNTEGINCNKCVPGYYRPYNKQFNETDVCQPCECNYHYSTGNCEEGSGKCECREEYTKPNCDSCAFGYFNYPNCEKCKCHMNGTVDFYCEPQSGGQCPCKENYAGDHCDTCAQDYYNFPACSPCDCNLIGSLSSRCEVVSGNCTCSSNYAGRTCDQCADGYHNFPTCSYCNCDIRGTEASICDKQSGACLCKEGYMGSRCDQCKAGYYGYPDCQLCNCSSVGSSSTACDATGKCPCLVSFGGKTCSQCSPGFYQYPECKPCNCDSHGNIGVSCDDNGMCQCEKNFGGDKCERCKEGLYNFPICEECNCNPAGVVSSFAGCGSLPPGELCQCKVKVTGRICDECKPLYWNLRPNNVDGCEDCDCYTLGTIGSIKNCDQKSGQCVCKATTQNRRCDACADGTFDLQDRNLFGCSECACDIGGSINNLCDKFSGQCICQARVTGRTCSQPLQAHYYPSLHHYQYEVEDGHTPSFSPVRFAFSNETFPNFSWRGYAVFSPLQNEIIQEVNIQVPSIYRMLLRYSNPNQDTMLGKIRIVPDTTQDDISEQEFTVQLKPTRTPTFVTPTLGPTSTIPSPLVLYPGRTSISITIKNSINPASYAAYLDYFVLLPQEFYEANILVERDIVPCTLNDQKLCRQFSYPRINQYDSVLSEGAYTEDDTHEPPVLFFNKPEVLATLNSPDELPLLNKAQPKLQFDMRITKPGPHILILTYTTPFDSHDSAIINIESTSRPQKGIIKLYSCAYTTPCRATVLDQQAKVSVFDFDKNDVTLVLTADENPNNNASIAVQSIVAIPQNKWSLDHIQPKTACVKKDGQCIQTSFPTSPETKKIEAESGLGGATQVPPYLSDNKTQLVYLDHKDASVDIKGTVNAPGPYVFVVHFYQPDFPEFDMDVLIQNGQFYEAHLPVKHCPANTGCRAVVQQANGNREFSLTENFVATFKEPNHKSVWLDYILLIPAKEFNENIVTEEPFDRTREFIDKCGQNYFIMDNTTSEFCKKSIYSITTSFLHGALSCQCDVDGSKSFECEQFGGQCQCLPYVIGRRCEICATGYYGFPYCKKCDCPATALCDTVTGACICPPRVKGDKCDQCESYTYGYDPIIGCDECNCHPHGVVNNSLQCDLNNGSCSCKDHIVGRTCDHCIEGHWSFPYCVQCECDLRGTTDQICDQTTAECFCKKNVHGTACDLCKDGTFDIQTTNPEGCTRCFCFGKTTKCSSSTLYRSQITSMDDWKLVGINVTKTANIEPLDSKPVMPNPSMIQVDLLVNSLPDKIIYFAAPQSFLGNKVTSYGGHLNYSLYYNTGTFSSSISAADIIFRGADNISLIYYSYEQPVDSETTTLSLHIVENNFVLPSGHSATRELLMQVLERLKGIYIRAAYRDLGVIAQLSNVALDSATDDYVPGTSVALSVEKCDCPPNYTGLSCEECADGYYRSETGPYGGFCVPCDCHGHAATCDKVTGVCHECQNDTMGLQCEQCKPGYYGDATSPYGCMICACPLPIPSNNFASGCDVSESGEEISCQCLEGYMGALCQSCAPGYYGRPQEKGDYCKPCQCSGNINRTDPGSCDSVTGECTGCLHNSAGDACQFCAPGYYGDAIDLKNCISCACSECGTKECNHDTGTCTCKENVVGEKCESCAQDHYGFSSCQGCRLCECGLASESSQCDDSSGQCRCKPGVTGRTCNKCMPGFWNYTEDGCVSCGCNSNFSVGVGCNAQTGQCECLPGVIGDKCDHCPHRWVLVPDQGCYTCDRCTDGLLDTTDQLQNELAPVIDDFKTVAGSYFTTQRLHHINETAEQLNNNSLVGQNGLNFNPLETSLESLESEVRNLIRKAQYNKDSIDLLTPSATKFITDVQYEDKNVGDIVNSVKDAVRYVKDTVNILDQSKGIETEMALREGDAILTRMADHVIDGQDKIVANNTLATAEDLLSKAKDAVVPVNSASSDLNDLRDRISEFKDRIVDADDKTKDIAKKVRETQDLTERNKNAQVNAKIMKLKELTQDANDSLVNAVESTRNASKLLDEANADMENTAIKSIDLSKKKDRLKMKLDFDNEVMEKASGDVQKAKQHSKNLFDQAKKLDDVLSETRPFSNNALKAANAYKNIDATIEQAKEVATAAKADADTATDVSNGLSERTLGVQTRSTELLTNAQDSLKEAKDKLGPELEDDRNKVAGVGQTKHDVTSGLDGLAKGIESLSNRKVVLDSHAEQSEETAKETISKIDDIVQALPEKTRQAKQLGKDVNEVTKESDLTDGQLRRMEAEIPEIIDLTRKLNSKPDKLKQLDEDVKRGLDELKQKIDHARELADRVNLGAAFNSSSTLELRNPDNIADLGLNSRASLWFQTNKPNGLLFYIGNAVGTSNRDRRSISDDFMALQIENGFPILTVDLGSGPTQITSNAQVADDKWHQAIIERTGQNVRLSIASANTPASVNEAVIPGSSTVLDLNKDYSKLFLGGIPNNFEVQPAVEHQSFDGKIEDFSLGGLPVGLWNFVESSNVDGCVGVDRDPEQQPVGSTFNGDSYVAMDATKFELNGFKDTLVTLTFKTKAKDGLIFLAHGEDENSFLSVEMLGGHLVYQFGLGEGTKKSCSIATNSTYNDGNNHNIQAKRYSELGYLTVDNVDTWECKADGGSKALKITDQFYVGGYPGKHNIPDVINTGFDGCIDQLRISNNLADLNGVLVQDFKNVLPGCPTKEKSILSFTDSGNSFGRWPYGTVTDNQMTLILRFKSPHPNGLLAYAEDGSATFTLWLSGGELILRSGGQEVGTGASNGSAKYDDGVWHTVLASHNSSALTLIVDDRDKFKSSSPPNPIRFLSGNLYLGGVSSVIDSAAATNQFLGCIEDATLNGAIIDFATLPEAPNTVLGKCVIASVPGGTKPRPAKIPPLPIKEDDDRDSSTKPTLPTQVTTTPSPTPYGQCALPLHPAPDNDLTNSSGHRFGTSKFSRIEYPTITGRFKNKFDFSVDIKTIEQDGVVFYVADPKHIDYVALFMKENMIYFSFNLGSGQTVLSSDKLITNSEWHTVEFSRIGPTAKLKIDGDIAAEGQTNGAKEALNIYGPFYLGGVPLNISVPVRSNLGLNATFKGCLRNLKSSNKLVVDSFNSTGVIPCSEKTEEGAFFYNTGGYVKGIDSFRVGATLEVTMDVKPRHTSGVLMSVHGKKDYFVIQMLDGSVKATVENGKGAFSALFSPPNQYYFCDGQWHKISVTKTKNYIVLSVDNEAQTSGLGAGGSADTDTSLALFIGGHPNLHKKRPKGLETSAHYTGCIKNVKINNERDKINFNNVHGDVSMSVCPTI
uniref:Laminin subunit alpha n=1 Tax=Cacopsylla melanoneura TaxID=428564 RepID=A0A8D8UVI4_9HEMI